LDRTDELIISSNANASNIEISQKLDMSESAVRRTVSNLVESGRIRRFTIGMDDANVSSALAWVSANLSVPKSGALESLDYPAVHKPVVGSWGRLSAHINDKDAARAVIEDREHMFPLCQVYYAQEFVKRPPRDIRTFFIGEGRSRQSRGPLVGQIGGRTQPRPR